MRWCAHAVKFCRTTNHILLTNTEKQKDTQCEKKKTEKCGRKKLQLAKTSIEQDIIRKKLLCYTTTKGYHYAYPDWECEKKGGTVHTWYTWKQNKRLQPQSIPEQKKYARQKKTNSAINWQESMQKIWKETEMSSTKRNMITRHQPREKEKDKLKLVLVNRHVPQTPPHVYQINLVIHISRQPHTIEKR